MSPTLRFITDFLPLIGFFAGYKFFGLYAGTVALIALTLISLLITYAMEKRLAVMPLVSGGLVAVFGGLTLWLQDETFIKMKPTIVNLLFAAVLTGGLMMKKNLLQLVLGQALSITDEGWRILSQRWAGFFIFLACLNEFIWRHYPTEFWVSFKVFGMFTLTMAFALAQIGLIQRSLR